MLITQDEIDGMRQTIIDHFFDTCDILGKGGTTSDGQGGTIDAGYTTKATNVPCGVSSETGREVSQDGRVQFVQSFNVRLPWNADVTPPDRIVWNGKMLEVQSTTGNVTLQTTVVCTLIQ